MCLFDNGSVWRSLLAEDYSIFVFFIFKNHKNNKLIISHIYFPQKGTLTVTPGMGGEGPFRTPNHKQSQQISTNNKSK